MDYFVIKAIHVIMVVSYFAGLFYIVRLMIYHTDAQNLPSPEKEILSKQYLFMEKRLWNVITVPAFMILIVMGITMLIKNPTLFSQGWMHVKLTFVILLMIYHFFCWKKLQEIKKGQFKSSSVQLRMFNELATIILFVVVFAVILKSLFIQYWYWAAISFLAVGIIIMLIVRLVNRDKK